MPFIYKKESGKEEKTNNNIDKRKYENDFKKLFQCDAPLQDGRLAECTRIVGRFYG